MSDAASIPVEMRALVLDGIGFDHLAVRRVPVPKPGPKQLLARVDAAGICTSLIKLIEQGPTHSLLYDWDVKRFPIVLGDEGSITIVRVGAELTGKFEAGRRCVVQPAVDHEPVNHRERYRSGGQGIEKVAVGYTLPGHLAEYMLITEEAIESGCVLPLPDGSPPFAHAAISEPISCCISAQEHHLHIVQDGPFAPRTAVKGLKRDGVTVVIGAGVMGRMHIDTAMVYGPRVIVSTDLVPERLELVEKLFADRARRKGIEFHTVDPAERDLKAFVDELTGRHGADDVIVAVGARAAIEDAQALCGRGAVLNLFGGLKKDEDKVNLDTGIVHYREINVTGSSGGSPWDLKHALELIAKGAIETSAHITRIGDLEHAAQFLGMIQNRSLNGKAVVYPHRRADRILSVNRWTGADERKYLGA
jgi:threonine dehydrogenase-like Zn-dependent dehydrogenase